MRRLFMDYASRLVFGLFHRNIGHERARPRHLESILRRHRRPRGPSWWLRSPQLAPPRCAPTSRSPAAGIELDCSRGHRQRHSHRDCDHRRVCALEALPNQKSSFQSMHYTRMHPARKRPVPMKRTIAKLFTVPLVCRFLCVLPASPCRGRRPRASPRNPGLHPQAGKAAYPRRGPCGRPPAEPMGEMRRARGGDRSGVFNQLFSKQEPSAHASSETITVKAADPRRGLLCAGRLLPRPWSSTRRAGPPAPP